MYEIWVEDTVKNALYWAGWRSVHSNPETWLKNVLTKQKYYATYIQEWKPNDKKNKE